MQTLMNTEKELTRMQYEVIDNYLPKEEFEAIKNIMMGFNFPWYYNPDVAALGEDKYVNSMYFTHNFCNGAVVNSGFFDVIRPLLNKIGVKALVRVKGNLYTNVGSLLENDRHVDDDFSHKGAIFYINTNNGPTTLEDGTKIDSVANRVLLFDPSKPHHSTFCTDQKIRVNININYF
jgi:hypothetical protein